MTALIQIENVSKFYYMGGETIRALDDISLDISQGEFVAMSQQGRWIRRRVRRSWIYSGG
ncbi:hypothetical protein [Paenibacillus sp. Soil750]|uniref:hypothetical protein n=1 Tax=Paenibacillus sp. Soil750 TaxID=1736398 RepID=UPI0006FDB85C|nr:hypothetical protein [Paenibacillus sp. Soil750]KRE64503.1 hypothetical protein ASL11_20665 [Paenibacillus sp. Soil750]